MVGRTPTKEQDQEIVELIDKLKEKLGFTTDRELAEFLDCQPHTITRWKNTILPKGMKQLIKVIVAQSKITMIVK